MMNSSSSALAIERASLLISKTAWKIWLTSWIRAMYALVRSTAVNLRVSRPEAISSRVMLSNDGGGSALNIQKQVIHFSIRYWKDMVGGGLTYLPLFSLVSPYASHNLVVFRMESLSQGKLRCVTSLCVTRSLLH